VTDCFYYPGRRPYSDGIVRDVFNYHGMRTDNAIFPYGDTLPDKDSETYPAIITDGDISIFEFTRFRKVLVRFPVLRVDSDKIAHGAIGADGHFMPFHRIYEAIAAHIASLAHAYLPVAVQFCPCPEEHRAMDSISTAAVLQHLPVMDSLEFLEDVILRLRTVLKSPIQLLPLVKESWAVMIAGSPRETSE